MSQLRLVLALHNHQPVGNFDGVFEQSAVDSYRPFLEVLEDYPDIPISLHTSGSLLEWMLEHDTEYIDRLNTGEMVARDEILAAHPAIGERIFEELATFLEVYPPEDPPVAVLGDYRLVRRIGAGGMGVVYEAWQVSVERSVALKVLPAGIAADTRALLRFLREGRVAGKLRHASIVAVHGMGVESDTPYYAMELVEGLTLAQLFQEAARDVQRRPRARFVLELARRLRFSFVRNMDEVLPLALVQAPGAERRRPRRSPARPLPGIVRS